jgi:hypothetical protein
LDLDACRRWQLPQRQSLTNFRELSKRWLYYYPMSDTFYSPPIKDQPTLDDLHPRLSKIRDVCEEVLKSVHRNRRNIKGAINWADLSCADVEQVTSLEGDDCIRVIIEEAAPENPEFQEHVRIRMKRRGFNVDVVTEW